MRLTLVVLSLMVLASCVKKREESFVQGHGRDMLAVSDYDGKEFPVETLGLVTDFKENLATTKSEKMTVTKEAAISKMGAVKVNTTADLLADAPFIALPNQKTGYKIKYLINNDYLVVLKVADKKLIHPREIPGAMKMGGDVVGVPLVGYPIRGFSSPENVEQNGAKSNKLMEMTVSDKEKAKFFRIDKNSRIIYKLQEKMDLFPKEYFVGADGKSEWYFAQTIIGAPLGKSRYLGYALAQYDGQLNSLSKIRFNLNNPNEMTAITINIDSQVNKDDEINHTPLVSLPIEWKEYRPLPQGPNSFAMAEEEDNTMDWTKKRYIKVNFERASTMEVTGSFRFVDMEVDTNYFSFTLYDAEKKIRVKQSFLRDSGRKPYVPKRAFKKDMEKFGFFTTQRHEINNYKRFYQQDFGNNVFLNRFNPASGEVVYYFTENSDEELIPYAAKAADEWSEAFAKAGIPLKVRAVTDKDQRKKLGDLRYNQINLMRSVDTSGLMGYGPSITDPMTGEIISATTNMHLSSIESMLVGHIREYINYKAGLTKSLAIFVDIPVIDEKVADRGTKLSIMSDSMTRPFLTRFPVLGLDNQLVMKPIEYVESEASKKLEKKKLKNFGREFDISVTGKDINKEIDNQCKELEPLIATLANSKKHDVEENATVIACARKLMPNKIFGTLLHEMGHNFGLRHNFYGSVDAINFYKRETTVTEAQIKSSSVMEYPSFNEDRMNKIGLYDIAALRFGYGNSIETDQCQLDSEGYKKCETIAINPAKSIEENLDKKKARPYMFCTDEDVMVGTDPMCEKEDDGTTPAEVVDNLIQEYNASIASFNYRLDRQRLIDPVRLSRYRLRAYWIPMKKIYDEWRYKLSDYLGIGSEYLDSYGAHDLQVKIDNLTRTCNLEVDPQSQACQIKGYELAAEKIFKFALQIATLPPKYCIGYRYDVDKAGNKSNPRLAAIEFADVRRILMATEKEVPKSCTDEKVKAYVLREKGFEPSKDSGYELEDVRLDMKVKFSGETDWFGNPIAEPPDIIGLMPEKAIALEVLAVRAALSMSADTKPFRPNFIDEPRFREQIMDFMSNRLGLGIDIQKIVKEAKESKLKYLEKFKYEKKFVDNMVYTLMEGLTIPDKTGATKDRKAKYSVKKSDKKENYDKGIKKVLSEDGTNYYYVQDHSATEAIKLMEKMESLPKRIEAAIPVNSKTFVKLIEMAKKVLPEDGPIKDPKGYMMMLHQLVDDEYSLDSMKVSATKYVRPKDLLEMDKNRFHWRAVFPMEAAKIRQQMKNCMEDDGNSTRDWEFYFEVMGPQLIKEIQQEIPNYTLTQKDLLARIEKYVKEKEEATKSGANDDTYDYEELKTQYDMVTDALRRMSW